MNPVVKLFALISFAVMVLLLNSATLVLAFLVGVMLTFMVTRSSGFFKKGIISFAVAIFLAQLLLVPHGEPLMQLWVIRLTEGALASGILIVGKFLSLIMMSWIFVSTTRPNDLSASLSGIGVPYRFGFMLVLAMRFVPLFKYELSTVRQAQQLRGLRTDATLSGLIRSARYTTLPMLVTALSRVNTLASSMEGRGFGAYSTRTYLHPIPFRSTDFLLTFIILLAATCYVILSRQITIW